MTARLTSNISLIFCLGFASALFGQIDSYQLRAKYGPPLDRETFTISPGFQIIVDYGTDRQVCRLEVPANQPGVGSQKQVDDVLMELVPMSMRGKQLGSLITTSGNSSFKYTMYEHVDISEPVYASDIVQLSPVRVTFKREACQNP